MPHGHAQLGETTPRSVFYEQGRFGRLFPTLPPFAADTQLIRDDSPSSAPRAVRRTPGTTCPTRSLDHRPGQERQQPEQPRGHRRGHVPRPVPRPRHDLRPDLEPGPPAGPRGDPELPHPRPRPRQRLRGRAGRLAAPVRPDGRRGPDLAAGRGDPRVGGGVDRRFGAARPPPQRSERRPGRRPAQRREPSRGRRYIDWQTFFDFGDTRVRPNKKIDTTLSSVLFELLGQPEGEPTSLATRNLLRNLAMKVPSGQRVARAMELPELAAADLDDLEEFHLHRRTPLWFYVLREAEVTADGEHLGPVGGRIVAEVLVGLVRGDRQSYLRQDPNWIPTYGSGGSFAVTDLLTAADAVAAIR